MPTSTSNYGLQKPLVNNATDQDLWGGYLNTDLDSVDTLIKTAINLTPSAATGTITVTAPTAASTTTGSSNTLYLCNATSGAFAANLPAASTASGLRVAFKKTDATANAITITANASDKIDGSGTYSLSAQYAYVVLACDGSGWDIISQTAASVSVFTGDSGSGGTTGTVPAPAAGDAAANKFLKASGAWAAPIITKSYNSGAQTYSSGGTLTLAHGLGAVPKIVTLFMTCVTGELGFSAGQVLHMPAGFIDLNGNNGGVSVVVDATNLTIKFGTVGFGVTNFSTGAGSRMTQANWSATFEAYA